MEQVKTVSSNKHRDIIGLIIVVIGALFLLRSMDIIDLNVPSIIFSFPFVLLAIGVIILFNSRNKFLGTLLTVIGGLFLLERIFPFINIDADIVIPLFIIGFGVYIIVKQRSSKFPRENYMDEQLRKDFIDDVAIFGGGTKIIHSDSFKGGSITAIFGGSEVDLINCKLAEGNNVLDVLTIFGGCEIFIPKDWNVIINVTPIFGGFSNKVRRDPGIPTDQTRTLIVKGVAIFGGGEIKTRY